MNTIQTGQRSDELLNDPVIQTALELVETTLINEWKSAQSTEVREELWYTLQGQTRFKHTLQVAIDNGKFESGQQES